MPEVLLRMNSAPPKSWLRRFFSFVGGFLNGLRKTLHLILLLVLFVPIILVLTKRDVPMKSKTTLVLNLKGNIVEQYSGRPSDRLTASFTGDDVDEVQLRDIRSALKAAATDPNIVQVLVRTDELTGAGVATLREVGKALTTFKASKKPIHAYAYGYDQRGLYIAAHTDGVWLHPGGLAMLEGLGRNRTYYKTLLDNLGVDVAVFRVGEFKSAVEPYLRDGPSAEAAAADRQWLGDIWQIMLSDFAALRGRSAADYTAMIEELPQRLQAVGGNPAQLAMDEKLVDELLTPAEVVNRMLANGAADPDDEFLQIGLKAYVAKVVKPVATNTDTVGIIVAEGGIADGTAPPGAIGGDSTAALVRMAREDKHIKAVVLRVDSPGGSGFASEVIRNEIELTRAAGKPVVVSMGDVAASGGYWISMTSDTIFADEATITGSIGIYALFPSAARALDKIGVHAEGTTTTWLAGALDPMRPLDPRLGALLDAVIKHGYQDFIGKVAQARNTTPEAIDAVARGRVWSAGQAKERGLIDQLGGLDAAIADAAKRANLQTYATRYVEEELSGFDRLLAGLNANSAVKAFGLGQHSGLPKDLLELVRSRGAERDLRMLLDTHKRSPLAIYSYCFCDDLR
jgi:protease-4